VALSVTMTACSTLAAPIMTPLMVYLYAGQSVDVDYQGMVRSIVTTVVAPVVAGIAVNWLLMKAKVNASVAEKVLAATSMIAICMICGLIAANSQALILCHHAQFIRLLARVLGESTMWFGRAGLPYGCDRGRIAEWRNGCELSDGSIEERCCCDCTSALRTGHERLWFYFGSDMESTGFKERPDSQQRANGLS
jgi:hypothetical protein